MKLIKADKFKDTWIIYQSDFVNNVYLSFEELIELGDRIEEIKEKVKKILRRKYVRKNSKVFS